MELFNTFIGLAGLIVATIALFHSVYYNMVKIRLSDFEIEQYSDGYGRLYRFRIVNLSNVAVVIENVELFDESSQPLEDNNYNPQIQHSREYQVQNSSPNMISTPWGETDVGGLLSAPYIPLDDDWLSKPFKRPIEVFPADKREFSYYLDKKPKTVKITTNKRIFKFRKYQLFPAYFD